MKKRLLKLLQAKEARKTELGTKINTTEDVKELRSINTELETINGEIAELRSMIDSLPDENEGAENNQENNQQGEQRNQPIGGVNVLGTYGVGQAQQEQRAVGKFDTPEYRSAFMDFVLTGKKSDNLELRADATTGTGDIGAVIPTTILNKIIEKMKDYGMIWSRVTKTNIKGGVELPVASVKPTANWIAEGNVASKQKKTVTGKVVFAYHKLQIRVAVTLEADTVSLSVFEQTVTDNIYEAMVIGLEKAIISGSGEGQPLGITKDTEIPAAQKIEVAADEITKYQDWTALLAKLPRKYRNRAVIILNDLDWNKYIVGMVDGQGQPVARTTYGLDGIQQERFLGKEVIPVEDYLPSIDDANAGEVIGIVCTLSDYIVNSNMQMTFKRYFDENTDEWISKSTMICDGRLGDKNGVLLLTKKAAG
ncbi:phage major capsid protein [Natronincola ferrireducens]|uniref:Phage major capsid protein, HK97 family n=1 Tax=Natronincola ferrireducens TaxID=393762 RepID=A0A1G9I513_9FIRM|nr:phage major capsid protein [Natronincola ferrireducens]SDL20321.1 phage major capsid protein, HK97 family [Natronincola ferrireducens]